MAVSRFSDYGVGNRSHNYDSHCLIKSSLKQLSGIVVDSVNTAAVNQNLNQEAAVLILKEAENFHYFLCYYLVLWLYTYYLLGPGRINFQPAVATKSAPSTNNIIPQRDIKVDHIDHPGAADTNPGAGTASPMNGGVSDVAPSASISMGDSDVLRGDFSSPNGNGGSNREGIGASSGSNGGRDNEDSNGDGSNESGEDADRTSFEGVLFLIFATISGVTTTGIELDASKHTDSQKLLLVCIHISAAICFLSSFSGLLGVIMRVHGYAYICGISLISCRRISLIIAVAFMMVTMIMVFVFVLIRLSVDL